MSKEGDVDMSQNIDQITYSMIKKSLDASSLRSRIVANNIANVDTKGFKASEVNFEDKLRKAMSNEGLALDVTEPKHIEGEVATLDRLKPDVVKEAGTTMKADGNNVDIDNEMTNLAGNTIMYNTLISQASAMMSMRSYVITGGSR